MAFASQRIGESMRLSARGLARLDDPNGDRKRSGAATKVGEQTFRRGSTTPRRAEMWIGGATVTATIGRRSRPRQVELVGRCASGCERRDRGGDAQVGEDRRGDLGMGQQPEQADERVGGSEKNGAGGVTARTDEPKLTRSSPAVVRVCDHGRYPDGTTASSPEFPGKL